MAYRARSSLRRAAHIARRAALALAQQRASRIWRGMTASKRSNGRRVGGVKNGNERRKRENESGVSGEQWQWHVYVATGRQLAPQWQQHG